MDFYIAAWISRMSKIFIMNRNIRLECCILVLFTGMVRTYIRKKPRPTYSQDDMQKALEAIRMGQFSQYRASKLYKIPQPTLSSHLNKRRGVNSMTGGRPTAIPFEEEKKITNCLKTMEKWGFGLSKKEVLENIGRYVNENGIDTPFKNGIPGDDYFNRLRKTFNLSLKKPQAVEVARKKSTDPFVVSDYFSLLQEVTTNVSPTQIYNVDETSFCLDPSRIKVVGEKGTAAHRVTGGSGRENISVLLGGNAVGEKLAPLIVFKGKNVWDSWMAKGSAEYPNMAYAATKNGWMESETFRNYFLNNFLPNIPPDRPVVLIYDGHTSHVNLSLVQKAQQENVIILKLPPHTTHLLQPMDLSVFKPLHFMWDERLIKWQRQNYGRKLPKSTFSSIISEVWQKVNPSVIQNGFKKAGIFPLCNSVVPIEKYDPVAYKRWCANVEHTINNNRMEVLSSEETIQPTMSVVESTTQPSISHEEPTLSLYSSTLNVQRQKSFEELLLQQVKQAPVTIQRRKKVCIGAEVITSAAAIAKLREHADNKSVKQCKPTKRVQRAKKETGQ